MPGKTMHFATSAEAAAYVERLGEQLRRDSERKLVTELLLAGVDEDEIDAAVQLVRFEFAKTINRVYVALESARRNAATAEPNS